MRLGDLGRFTKERAFRWPTLAAVRGDSMRPTIRHGDLVLVTRPEKGPFPGEVILLQTPVGAVVHRVVGCTLGEDGRIYYGTAGDANRRVDAFVVPGDMILGTVRARLPWLGIPHLGLTRALAFLATHLQRGHVW